MQVSKWGNSLAVRLPKKVVDRLGLKEGDTIEIDVAGDRRFEVRQGDSREAALGRIANTRLKLPGGFTFDREELYER